MALRAGYRNVGIIHTTHYKFPPSYGDPELGKVQMQKEARGKAETKRLSVSLALHDTHFNPAQSVI